MSQNGQTHFKVCLTIWGHYVLKGQNTPNLRPRIPKSASDTLQVLNTFNSFKKEIT